MDGKKGLAVICVDHMYATLEFNYAVIHLFEQGYDVRIVGDEKDHIYFGERYPTEWNEEKKNKMPTPLPMGCLRDLLDKAFIGGNYPTKTMSKFSEINPKDVKILFVPGGLGMADRLRLNNDFLNLLNEAQKNKVMTIMMGHGVWTGINAGILKNKTVTAMPSMKQDIINSGAKWSDETFVRDECLFTAQSPLDLPRLFNELSRI